MKKKPAGWAESAAQQSVPRRPLSPNVVIDPPTNVTQDRNDKRFSTYPKSTPLFQPGEGILSTQLTEPNILRKPKICKPIGVMDTPAPPLTRTTFQQQGTSAVQDRNRSPINSSKQFCLKLSKQFCREQKQKHNQSNQSPSHLPTSSKQWCQWLSRTKTDLVSRRPPGMVRMARSF